MKKILLLILLLGAALRLLLLGEIPIGFFRDEAAMGYNAYSILKTGMDEFGMSYPLVFRSFEVFFLPLYVYLTVIPVGLMGLTEFSVRILSALSGVLTIFTAYLIAKEVWNEKVGLWGALVLAISPWHIFYSRGTFEGNLALCLFSLGFYFWIRFVDKWRIKNLIFSGVFFAISMYSYQAERLVVPLFALGAVIINFDAIWKARFKLVLPLILFAVILTPLFSLTMKAGGTHRAFGVSIFSKTTNPPGWIDDVKPGFIANNKFYLKSREVASLYLSYFSPRNLFIEGDYDRQRSVQNFSVLYPFMFPVLLLGLWFALKKSNIKIKLLIVWMLLGPVPAALTGDPFHTYRSLLTYLPLCLFIGYGIYMIFDSFKKYQKLLYLVLGALGAGSLVLFIYNYVFITQAERANYWDYGYKEVVEFASALPAGTRVIVDDPSSEAYIYFLFFGGANPAKYQEEIKKLSPPSNYYYESSEEIRPNRFGSFEFRPVDWPKERGDAGTVFVMWQNRLPESEFKTDPKVKLLKEIFYPDGKLAFRIVQIL
jgi:4-amino-4-deoxy-L-arabinose transferase-like glycosyltransferase